MNVRSGGVENNEQGGQSGIQRETALETDRTGKMAEQKAEEMEMLLPWYITGRLSSADKADFEAYLSTHPAFAEQLALAREEQETTQDIHQTLGAPRPGGLDQLMRKIADEPKASHSFSQSVGNTGFSGIFAGLKNLLPDLNQPLFQAGAALGVFLLLAQAAVIGFMLSSNPPANTVQGQKFETASGPTQTAPAQAHLIVAFQNEASAQSIADLLSEADLTIIAGPKAGGLYELRVADLPKEAAAATKKIEEIAENLNAQSAIIKLASPVE